jgi:hypothetical protein
MLNRILVTDQYCSNAENFEMAMQSLKGNCHFVVQSKWLIYWLQLEFQENAYFSSFDA